jgi:hypothetical protein
MKQVRTTSFGGPAQQQDMVIAFRVFASTDAAFMTARNGAFRSA